jgi:hypothetical protein
MALPRLPLEIGATTAIFSVAGPDPGHEPTARSRRAERNGLDVHRISSRAGRLFEATGRAVHSPPVALVNRTAARRSWPGEDPIDKQNNVSVQFGYEHDAWTAVGVIDAIRTVSLLEEPEPDTVARGNRESVYGWRLVPESSRSTRS